MPVSEAKKAILLAMLDAQIEATARGEPKAAARELKALAGMAGDPKGLEKAAGRELSLTEEGPRRQAEALAETWSFCASAGRPVTDAELSLAADALAGGKWHVFEAEGGWEACECGDDGFELARQTHDKGVFGWKPMPPGSAKKWVCRVAPGPGGLRYSAAKNMPGALPGAGRSTKDAPKPKAEEKAPAKEEKAAPEPERETGKPTPEERRILGLMKRMDKDADRGATIDATELREQAGMGKEEFDRAVLSLAEKGVLDLHRHVEDLAPEAAAKLVQDGRGNHYLGIAKSTHRGAAPLPDLSPEEAAGKPAPSEEKSEPSPDELQGIADATRTGAFGPNKVMISHAYEEAKKKHPGLTLDRFKQLLLDASAQGKVELARADLVQAMHPDDVERSETNHPAGLGKFHLLRVKPDDTREWTKPPEPEKKLEPPHRHTQAHDALRQLLGDSLDSLDLSDPRALAEALKAKFGGVAAGDKAATKPEPAAPEAKVAGKWSLLGDSEGATTRALGDLVGGKMDELAAAAGGGELSAASGGGLRSVTVFGPGRERLLSLRRDSHGGPLIATLERGAVGDLGDARTKALRALGVATVHDERGGRLSLGGPAE